MKKQPNEFGATTGTTTAAEVVSDMLKESVERLTATTRKTRTINPRMVDLLKQQEQCRVDLAAAQAEDREALRAEIKADALAAKAAARRARILAAMSAEEREQLRMALEKQ